MDSSHSAELERLGIAYGALFDFVHKHRIGTELLLASIVICVYDILTTFDLEVRFVWMVKPRITSANVLFVLNRYVPVVGFMLRFICFTRQTPANPLCNIAVVSAYLAFMNFATVELVLMLRIWVLYDRSKRVGTFMVLSLAFLVTVGIGFALRDIQPMAVAGDVFTPPMTVTICRRSSPSQYFWAYLFGAIQEVLIFSLLLKTIYLNWKTQIISPIMDALLNHGTLYYLIVISMFVFTVVSATSNILFWPMMDSNITVCISCIACNHLVLSLRGLYYTGHFYLDDSKVASISGVGCDFRSSTIYTTHVGRLPADPLPGTFAQAPPSSFGGVTLDEEERRSTMRQKDEEGVR